MKTAMSIPNEIFKEAEKAAREFKCSRSEFFTIATKEFLEKINSRKLLNAINEAFSEEETSEETSLRQKSKRYYSRKVLKERY